MENFILCTYEHFFGSLVWMLTERTVPSWLCDLMSCVQSPVSCVMCPSNWVLCPVSCVLPIQSCVLCIINCISCPVLFSVICLSMCFVLSYVLWFLLHLVVWCVLYDMLYVICSMGCVRCYVWCIISVVRMCDVRCHLFLRMYGGGGVSAHSRHSTVRTCREQEKKRTCFHLEKKLQI